MEVRVRPHVHGKIAMATGGMVVPYHAAPALHLTMKARCSTLSTNSASNQAMMNEHKMFEVGARAHFDQEAASLSSFARKASESRLAATLQAEADSAHSQQWLNSWRSWRDEREQAKLLLPPSPSGFGTAQFSQSSYSMPTTGLHKKSKSFAPGVGSTLGKTADLTAWLPRERRPGTGPVSAITLDMETKMRQRYLFGGETQSTGAAHAA
eukprot:TRINITY_DN10021_c0_g1_i1.p1 TRINITY_DN10021_c0_g1~~TRINITY_DN10021_c0_g1_i1.p1  ORF type:complete len:233 (-),score=29.62 TRINITY_DN10021_c0_g1_i1:168-797(-)